MTLRLLRNITFVCALLLVGSGGAAGQVVLGELVAAEDRRPLPGTLITLVDSSGMRWGRYVTNAAGRFILRPSMPGRYMIRAERIGYQVATSPMLSVGKDTLLYRFAIQPLPVQLPGLDVASRDRGCERHRDGTAVATLWNEIRKALNVAAWTEETANLTYGSNVYRMSIDTEHLLLRSEEKSTYTTIGRMPFSVASAADLARRGFSRSQGDDLYLLAPDAAVLTSAEFVDTHCFHLMADQRRPDLIGLSFAPLRRRDDIVDINGTLWVDRASSALRRLEFTFTNLPRPVSEHGARGEMKFLRLDNGLWIVESWRIQGPALVLRRRAATERLEVVRVGITEDGGLVLRASDGEVLLWEVPRGRSAIEGIARKAPGGDPLPGARVFLAGTGYEAVSDARGRYRIDSLPAGRYALTFSHDIVKDVPFSVAIDSLNVGADTTLARDVTIPGIEEITRMVCPNQAEDNFGPGLIYGVVRDSDGAPIAGAQMRAEWEQPSRRGGSDQHYRNTRTDAMGRYYLCWMPVDDDILLSRTVRDGFKAPTQSMDIRLVKSALPIMRVDFP
jgi:hypothetical protein